MDLSYHQDWCPFILTLELHPIRPNQAHCGPFLPPRLVSLHPYLGTPPNKAQRGPLWTSPTTRTGVPLSLPLNSTQYGPMRPTVDLSYHQDWSPFMCNLELHPFILPSSVPVPAPALFRNLSNNFCCQAQLSPSRQLQPWLAEPSLSSTDPHPPPTCVSRF